MTIPNRDAGLPEAGADRSGSDILDAVVVGTGLAGLAAALAMQASGLATGLVGPLADPGRLARDTRSTALFGGSIELLRHVGVWGRVAPSATPLTGLRLVDDSGSLVRAPEVLFASHEIGLETFGFNVENALLLTALSQRVAAVREIRMFPAPATQVVLSETMAEIVLADGTRLRAHLVIGADGEHSLCRAAAGMAARTWSYPQTAIATRFSHSRPHGGVSTELHRRAGPLTTVPLAGDESSLVWVETPAEAQRLMALEAAAFARELQLRLQGLLGRITAVGPRALFPIAGLTAEPMARDRVALVGEAAHRLPPIGAQGLNLGLRDIGWLAEVAAEAVRQGGDPGERGTLAAYCEARRADVFSRTLAVDTLNRTLIAGLLPADLARTAGLVALVEIPWLRRLLMREGVAPGGRQPSLLTPPAESVCDSVEA
jgi:2-octaprenyl-6-methoxyphenol hydroxylase